MMKSTINVFIAFLLVLGTEAFAPSTSHQTTTTTRTSSRTALSVTRRSFVTAAATFAFVAPAFALDDISMPTEEESKKMSEEEAMKLRLAKKAELQKKAAQPRTFQESLKGELEKQSDFKKQTKAERMAAMCEELGRGC